MAEYPDLLDVFFADGAPAPSHLWASPPALRGATMANAVEPGEHFAPSRNNFSALCLGRDIEYVKVQAPP